MGPRGPVRLKLKRSKQTKQDGNQRYIWRCPDPKTGCFDHRDIGVLFYLEMSCDRNVTDSHTTKLYFYANLKQLFQINATKIEVFIMLGLLKKVYKLSGLMSKFWKQS